MAGLHLWEWFWQLHGRRGYGFGPSPIAVEALSAFSSVMRMPMAPWEALAIMAMDDAYLSEANPPKSKSKVQPATAENTKALFKGLGAKQVTRTPVGSPSLPK